MKVKKILPVVTVLVLIVTLFGALPATAAPDNAPGGVRGPKFYDNVAFASRRAWSSWQRGA